MYPLCLSTCHNRTGKFVCCQECPATERPTLLALRLSLIYDEQRGRQKHLDFGRRKARNNSN
jgi:hypothetical protein